MKVLTEERGIRNAIGQFRANIKRSFSGPMRVTFTFPGVSEQMAGNQYRQLTEHGELTITFPDEEVLNNRMLHFACLGQDRQGAFSPDVEINIPLGLDRRVTTCCVQGGESVLICSRGRVTAYMAAIKKSITLEFFHDWLIPVLDGRKSIEVIPITTVDSRSLAEDIGRYVRHVKMLKDSFKRENFCSGSLENKLVSGDRYIKALKKILRKGEIYDAFSSPDLVLRRKKRD